MQFACAILSSMAYPALQYIFTLFHKRHDFRKKKVIEQEMGFLYSPQILCEKYFVLRGIQRDMIINVHWSDCKEPIILARL